MDFHPKPLVMAIHAPSRLYETNKETNSVKLNKASLHWPNDGPAIPLNHTKPVAMAGQKIQLHDLI